MSDVFAWRFLLFAVVFGGLLYLQFYLAHRQWKKVKSEQTSEIDVSYVRMEDYLAQSFRRKVRDWLKLPGTADGGGARTIQKGKEQIRVSAAREFGSKESCGEILVVEGDFSCGPECLFGSEILVKGNARVGSHSHLQSMAVDGDLSLASDVQVARWLDSARDLTIGANCLVGARITSLGTIRLGLAAQAASVYAPRVATEGWDGTFPDEHEPELMKPLEIAFAESSTAAEDSLRRAGFEPKKLIQLGGDCWIYKGDLRPVPALRLKNKLVVKGDCDLPEGSVLETDLRVDGSLSVGPNSWCKGNLSAGGDILLASGCRFNGLIHAGRSLQIGRGTRGFRQEGLVVAYAGNILNVERDVAIQGKLAAGGRVIVESPEEAETAGRRT